MHEPLVQKILKWLICSGFIATLVTVILLVPGHAAQALDNPFSALLGLPSIPINAFFLGVPYLIGLVGGSILTIASMFVSWFFILNTNIFPDKFGAIESGFQISLGIANLLFVVALIFIAFSTILNVGEYTAKKMLGKLIVAVVLINFSYLIVGAILDLSHVMTMYFISAGGEEHLGSGIGAILQPQKLLVPVNLTNLTTTVFSPSWWGLILGAVTTAIFTWIAAIVMAAIAIMFLVRYIYLAILIIVMPLAWALPLFPGGGELSSKWWHKFSEQLFYLPAATFFIYLSMKMALNLPSQTPGMFASGGTDNWSGYSNIGLAPQGIAQMLIVVGMLVGSLVIASKLGGAGTAFGKMMAGKITDLGKKYAKGVGMKAYSAQVKIRGKNIGLEQGVKAGTGMLGRGMAWQPKSKFMKGVTGTVDKATGWIPGKKYIAGAAKSVAFGGAYDQVLGQTTKFSEDYGASIKSAQATEDMLSRQQKHAKYEDPKKAARDDMAFYAELTNPIVHKEPDELRKWMEDEPTRTRALEVINRFEPEAGPDEHGKEDPTKSKTRMALATAMPELADKLLRDSKGKLAEKAVSDKGLGEREGDAMNYAMGRKDAAANIHPSSLENPEFIRQAEAIMARGNNNPQAEKMVSLLATIARRSGETNEKIRKGFSTNAYLMDRLRVSVGTLDSQQPADTTNTQAPPAPQGSPAAATPGTPH